MLHAFMVASPVVPASHILVGTAQGVEIRRLVDGRPAAQTPPDVGGVGGPIAVDDERLYFVNDASHLVVAQLDEARVVATVPGIDPGLPPVLAPNGLLVCGAGSWLLARHDHWLPSLSPWAPDLDGRPTSPAILHQGRVYVGIQGRGLVCLDGGDQ